MLVNNKVINYFWIFGHFEKYFFDFLKSSKNFERKRAEMRSFGAPNELISAQNSWNFLENRKNNFQKWLKIQKEFMTLLLINIF